MNKFFRLILTAVTFILICLTFSACSVTKQSTVYISEVMSQNNGVLSDEKGNYPDWIELHNPTDKAIDICGWSITDDGTDARKFVFPSIIIEPDEYFVIFADKNDKIDTDNRIIHVPFSLSNKKGEGIRLYNDKGTLIHLLNMPVLEAGQSFGIDSEGKQNFLDVATPGKRNSEKQATATAKAKKQSIIINEYSTNETQTLLDEDGDFISWVELYNKSSNDFSLSGYSLTDDETELQKWIFPNVTIKAKGYLVVYLSGKDKAFKGKGNLHAGFKISGKEQQLILADSMGNIADSCKIYKLFSNLSCGRIAGNNGKFAFFATATPGQKNTKQAFDSIDSANLTKSKELVITEVAAVNTKKTAPDGVVYDYVEIYNNTDKTIDLKNYKLSDSKNAESFVNMPDKQIRGNSYAVIWCGDWFGVSLDRYGETIYITDKNGNFVDSFTYGRLTDKSVCGRDINGNSEAVYYTTFTPGEANPDRKFYHSLKNPVFSKSSTYLKSGDKISIISDYDVYYTLDGSEPSTDSIKYSSPVKIKKTTTIRAKAYKSGFLPSDTVTATYIVGTSHSLPVVFLSTDNDNLYGYSNGIWADGPGITDEFPYVGANYWQDWERKVNFEYMTSDGVSQVNFDAGIKVFGQFSRALEQKSVSINLRDKYGPDEICYPFFENNDTNVFSSLVLRNSGQDFNIAHIRDAFCAMVIKNSVDVDIMDYRPVAVYVNGKYHGIYDLREKIDEDYIANHHSINKDKLDLIKGNNIVQSGSIESYNKLLTYIRTHDVTDEKVYNYICSQIDIDELISYWMCESFFTNTDTGNIRFYRENSSNGKWRWVFFDSDWSLFPSTYKQNYIDNYLNPNGHGVGHNFDTTIMSRLIKNKAFRKRVLEIHSKHLKTTFDTERMLKIFDSMIDEIDEEMKNHCNRWNSLSYNGWKNNVSTLRRIISENRALFIQKMKKSFNMTADELEKYLK